jgi:hypothetical protein
MYGVRNTKHTIPFDSAATAHPEQAERVEGDVAASLRVNILLKSH